MARVVPNLSGIAEMLRSQDVADELTERAERVLATARGSAPVDTGAYRNGLHIEQDVTDAGAVVRVAGATDHDIYVEANTGNLNRALDSAR